MWKYARNPWAVIWEQRRRLNALIKCLCLHNPSSILLSIHTLQFAVASWGAGFHHQPFQRYKLWYILSSAQQSASLFVMRQKDVWVRVCIWANPLIRSPIKCYRKSITTNKNSLANCAEMCNTFSFFFLTWLDHGGNLRRCASVEETPFGKCNLCSDKYFSALSLSHCLLCWGCQMMSFHRIYSCGLLNIKIVHQLF